MSPSVSSKKRLIALAVGFGLFVPSFAHAIFDFGGRVLNVPGAPGSFMSAGAMPIFPPPGVFSFWYPGPGVACLNGVDEVNILPASIGPVILLQFKGAYTFSKGPATHPGQLILGKYFPFMVCMALFVSWVYCGVALCPVTTPLPYYFAPLIIFNGSSI